jgi:3-carboxy-cis,cis-muconate cycloisomerase
MRAAVGAPHGEAVHFGATSQDLVDTALMVRLKILSRLFLARLAALEAALGALIERFGSAPMIGRTRMRAALAITVADRVAAWSGPLHRARSELPAEIFAVQLGGPVGTLAELGDAGPAVRARLAAALDLADAPCWHSQRDRVVRFADWLSHVSGALGKLGQDVALMAQDGVAEIALSGAGGSSAMAHKQNPVAAEVLVALARYNAALVSGLHQAQVHEQERSGTAWTLEWLALPQMAAATGAALRLALQLTGQVERMGGADG